MLNCRKIAITGGVASGKTTVCKLFEELGAHVVSADEIVHKLLTPETDLGQQIIRQFGPEIIKNGQINRRVLADKAFKDQEQLKKLEQLLHPEVLKEIEKQYVFANSTKKCSSFVVEIPLLYEIRAEGFFDVVIAVISDESIAKKRFQNLGFQEEDYSFRMKRQFSQEKKAANADYTIINNGSINELREQVQKINETIHKQ